jgi:hypothetical protein
MKGGYDKMKLFYRMVLRTLLSPIIYVLNKTEKIIKKTKEKLKLGDDYY